MADRINLLIVLVSTFLVTSCTDYFFETEGICFNEGGPVKTIKVVDQDSNPVTGAEFTVVNTRTGKEFCIDAKGNKDASCDRALGETGATGAGEYALISAYNTGSDDPTADVKQLDVIEATIKKNGLAVKPRYIVIFDDSYCYPDRVEGPDVVVLE
jgi:hypothetical protein